MALGKSVSSLGLSYSTEPGSFRLGSRRDVDVTLVGGFYIVLLEGPWSQQQRLHYLHSLALKVQAIFAGHLIEFIIFQEGLLHHPSGKQAEKLKLGTRWEGVTPSPPKLNAK